MAFDAPNEINILVVMSATMGLLLSYIGKKRILMRRLKGLSFL